MRPRKKYIRDCARLLLKRHGITIPPVDLEYLVKCEGLEFQEVDYFGDDVDALIISFDNRIVAAVNKNHHVHRRRFSLAHELCHHLHHNDRSVLEERMTIDSFDGGSFSTSKDVFESEADIFAGELLVPLHFLKVAVKNSSTTAEIARIFQVSEQVVSIAIKEHFNSLYK
jgi:Zn-dependent peptidase ImmA (M78 family)